MSTTAICRITLSLSRMLSAEKSAKDSAQSPAWSRKARPAATSASALVRFRASPANTSGGRPASCLSALSRAASSGHSGCCPAGCSRQLLGLHSAIPPAWSSGGPMAKMFSLSLARATVSASAAVRAAWGERCGPGPGAPRPPRSPAVRPRSCPGPTGRSARWCTRRGPGCG